MLKFNKVGLLGRLLLLLVVVFLVFELVSIRRQVAEVQDTADKLTQQVNEQTQANIELSNAIENRDNPDFVEDIARERLGLVSPSDRVFYITD
ncbi:MAG: septum formation initiator family protein [Ruminiclostridium sp.]|nr:septum formation initiator family protein [Ruminiclostridium sp.]